MKVWFVGAGPGDPDLLTVKARKLLDSARCCIFAGSLVAPEIVSLLPADAEKHDSARLSLPEILAIMQDARDRGMDVVRLHTGDPSIYGAIGEQMAELDKLGIPYEVVPGVSSFQAAAAALKVELTVPEETQTVILTRTAGRTPVPDREALALLARSRSSICLFLSADRLADAARDLIPEYGADCPAAVVYHASWPDQAIIRGCLADIASKVTAAGIQKTAMAIIGPSLRESPAGRSKLYDQAFTHGYREAKNDEDRNPGA